MYRFLSHGFMRPDIQPISDTATHVRVSPYVHVYTHASRRSCYAVLLPKWAETSPLTMENGLYSPSLLPHPPRWLFSPKSCAPWSSRTATLGRCPGLIAGAGGSSVNQCARQDGHSTSGSEAWDGSAPIHSFIYFFMKKLTPVPSPHLRCFSALPSACFARNGGEEGLWRVREQWENLTQGQLEGDRYGENLPCSQLWVILERSVYSIDDSGQLSW